MDYFISVHPRSNVRFSALFLDPEEKSSFYPNDFPSMILQKIICVFHGGKNCADNMANENVSSSFTATTETTSTLPPPPPPPQQSTVHRDIWYDSKRSNVRIRVVQTEMELSSGNIHYKVLVMKVSVTHEEVYLKMEMADTRPAESSS
ncbi:hypothetical protein Tco_0644580 [Tanacetum coccineum]